MNCSCRCWRFARRRGGIRSGRNRTTSAIADRTVRHNYNERRKSMRQTVECNHLALDRMIEHVPKSNWRVGSSIVGFAGS